MSTNQECELGAEKHGTAGEHAGDVRTATPFGVRRYIRVIVSDTGEVVRMIDVTRTSERAIDRIENGLHRNLNHNRFYTFVDPLPGSPPHD